MNSIFRKLAEKRSQRKFAARKVYIPEIGWTLQIPNDFTPLDPAVAQRQYELSVKAMGGYNNDSIYRSDNSKAVFSGDFDKFNLISGSLCSITEFTAEQIQSSREDCKNKLLGLFSRIPQSKVESSAMTCSIGGITFEQHSFLIIRNGKPILCMEYIYQVIGDYELSISLNYNNETRRQDMFRCLAESSFRS